MKFFNVLLAVSFAFVVGCARGPAAQRSDERCCPSQSKAEAKADAPQMSQEQMMAAWEKAATPSEGHKALNPLAGKWNVSAKTWMDPTGKPEISSGTADHRWILGNRFIEESYQGKMGGRPFQGRGVIGYDNTENKYVSVWTDTMTTGVFNQQGSFDGNRLVLHGQYTDPATGDIRKTKTVTTIANNDKHTFEMFEVRDNGQEFRSLEITYTRRKAPSPAAASK